MGKAYETSFAYSSACIGLNMQEYRHRHNFVFKLTKYYHTLLNGLFFWSYSSIFLKNLWFQQNITAGPLAFIFICKWKLSFATAFDWNMNEIIPITLVNQHSCRSYDIVNILPTYFGHFRHDRSQQPKLIIPTCRKVQCLSVCNEISQWQCKPVIFGTLGMTGYGHQKEWYQLVKNLDVYLHTTNQIYHWHLSWNIAKVLQICFFWVLWAWMIMSTQNW